MRYLLYILIVGLGVSIYGYVNSKVSYKQEFEIMKTHVEIHPNPELELEIDRKEKRIKKQVNVFRISILILILSISVLLFIQNQKNNYTC